MRRSTLLAIILAAVVGVPMILGSVASLSGIGGGTGPGSPAVYAEIETSSDCRWLQASFDQAAENNDRAPAGSSAFDWSLGYMRAADDRMDGLGCYG